VAATTHQSVGGRDWSNDDLAEVRESIKQAQLRQRTGIARRVCRALDWKNALGFGAAVWKVAARDLWIGWTAAFRGACYRRAGA